MRTGTPSPAVRLDPSGYFVDPAGRRFAPLGVNYWPASCGVEMWRQWPADEIRRDLDLVRSLGLNTVRWFVRWQDFEPTSGVLDQRMLDRFAELLAWHRERGLHAHPSLFVGWMSGGIFWPEWHAGRNPFEDPVLRERGSELAARLARICATAGDAVLAIDLGNELCCLPQSHAAAPAAVRAWCARMSAAIKEHSPGALVISGGEQTQVIADSGWRFGEQPGCGLYSMHSYPVSAWHALPFDGMADPLAQSLLPFYVKCARAWGPVLVQEFGTLLTRGERPCEAYLRAVLPACWRAGANGFLWWCLRDIAAGGYPYDRNPFERLLGLVSGDGRVKPGLRYFLEFARTLDVAAAAPLAQSTALYWPAEYYPRDNPLNPGNEPRELSRRMAAAHFALTLCGREPRVVRAGELGSLRADAVLVIAGARLTGPEIAALADWVEAGGRALWHGADAMAWGPELEALTGLEPLDFRAPRAEGVAAFGRDWTWVHFARDIFLEVRAVAAEVVAADSSGRPLITARRAGKGRIVVCLADVDAAFASRSSEPSARSDWQRWYHGMLELLEPDERTYR